ncbi:uncharacterized protein LOC114291637 [Camellia sinensis]|uniref:uncharacterized protein LOC114291637 n=1 Tax=Camellia sinensis TaxID=4442 RepID=UPI00103608EC|nr:uncharacterized protein LOC114291637 [Camellia sinensis]
MREVDKEQRPVYYVSKTLLDAETRYLQLEKLAYALLIASRKLQHYFQGHTINVLTEFPLRSVFSRADFSGRTAKWAVELGEFDIRYQPRTAIKAQVLADFVTEFAPTQSTEPGDLRSAQVSCTTEQGKSCASEAWKLFIGNILQLYVDGSSNNRGSRVEVVLISLEGFIWEQALRLGWKASNNEAEYEALLAGLRSAEHFSAEQLLVFRDSQLVVNQLSGVYETRDERMAMYAGKAKDLLRKFQSRRVELITRDKNSHADALACLGSSVDTKDARKVWVEFVPEPSIASPVLCNNLEPSWMDPIFAFLKSGTLPKDKREANKVRHKSARFWISPSGKLYRRPYLGPYLLCMHPNLVENVLYEIHDGICGCHVGEKSLAHRALTHGYCWPRMQQDAQQYPAKTLTPLTSPWPFAQWDLDIVGPLARGTGNRRFFIAATDYFTKWVKVKALESIKQADTKRFVLRSVVVRFGIPRVLIADNGTQFDGKVFRKFCADLRIEYRNSSPAYPQSNGQAGASNKTIINGVKKHLEHAKGKWVEELPHVLWAYRTTARRSMGETPYSLTYGMVAIIPLEVGLRTLRSELFESSSNKEVIAQALDMAEGRRKAALIRLEAYQQQLIRSALMLSKLKQTSAVLPKSIIFNADLT